jgi:AcrR family transcriptional regulator
MSNQRRRRPVSQETRTQIIAAARKVLAEQGFDATSIKEVAKAAGIAPGLIYYYFEDKEALLLAVVEDASEQYVLQMNPLRASQKGRSLGEGALAVAKGRVSEQPDWYRLRYELFALGLRNPKLRAGVARLLATGRFWVGETLRRVTPSGEASAATSAVMLALFDGLALQKLMDPDFDLDAAYREVSRLAGPLLSQD